MSPAPGAAAALPLGDGLHTGTKSLKKPSADPCPSPRPENSALDAGTTFQRRLSASARLRSKSGSTPDLSYARCMHRRGTFRVQVISLSFQTSEIVLLVPGKYLKLFYLGLVIRLQALAHGLPHSN